MHSWRAASRQARAEAIAAARSNGLEMEQHAATRHVHRMAESRVTVDIQELSI